MKKKWLFLQFKPEVSKLLKKMKITVFLLFVTVLGSLAADSYSQTTKLTLEINNSTVKEILNEIEAQSEFRFFYSGSVDVERKTSVSTKNSKIFDILDDIFEGTNVEYQVRGRQIALVKSDENIGFTETVAQQNSVSGKVIDESGQPLPGVSVILKGTTSGTVTNTDGSYTISDISNDAVLVFSFIGMETQEVSVGNQTTVNVTLATLSIGIDEVVAIGYGTMRKADLTGSVATVQSEDLIKISSTSTAQALQGRMSGVQITQSNGEPGSGSTIKIRGIGSLRSNNSPLILIDGYRGSIDGIDPNDIESVSVLKDASAASIYGARAANGVILVTTKRGKAGALKVEVTAEYGVSSLTKQPEFLLSRDYATKQNEEVTWTGGEPIWTGNYAPENLTGGTQWFDEVYGLGSISRYYASLSGGTVKTKYALSLGHTNQEGLIKNTNYGRLNARFNFDHKFNDKFSVGANFSLGRDKKHRGNENIWGDGIGYNGYGLGIAAVRSSPTVPVYFEDGTKGIYRAEIPAEYPGNGTLPPTWYFGDKDINDTGLDNRISLFAEIELIKGLKAKSIVNANQGSNYKTEWNGTWEAYSPGQENPAQQNSVNALDTRSSNYYGWEFQQLLTYDKTIAKHNISVLAGFSAEENTSEWVDLKKQNFPGNELRVANAGTDVVGNGGSRYITSLTSLFGRVKYDFADKYLLQATVRRDGSSAFAPGHQFGTFPSISGAWRIINEGFMKEQSFLSDLKLRVGYGELGNAGIPSFKWISTYALTDAHPFNDQFQPAYYTTEMTNEDVKWETTTTIDFGLDFGLLDNKLRAEFDYYDKSTTDLLWPATLPLSSGAISGPMVNIGEVQNKGWELTVNWDDKIGDLKYGLSANISHNENEVVDMGGIPDQLNKNSMIKEGYPINSFWGHKVDGIWRTWDELANNPHREGDIRPGDYRFLDISGPDGEKDGVINSEDMTYLGDALPDFYYGFSGYAEYKNFDVSFLLNGEAGKQTMIEAVYGGGYRPGFNSIQWFFDNRAILDENGEVISGTTNASGANNAGGNSSLSSEANVFDISYLRVKNIQLGYTLPINLLGRLNIKSARIYVNATNPFLFTDYVGWDQETSDITNGKVNRGGNQYVPISKTYSVGVSVKF